MDILVKRIINASWKVLGIISLPITFILTIVLYAVDEAHKQMKK